VLQVWSAFSLLMIVSAVPLYSTVLPPLFDYPNHLARMHLLTEGGNGFYTVHWAPLPNLAQDLIVPPLARLMPLESASKLFVVMTFGVMVGGTIWLNRIATGAWRLWPLMAFLLLYSRIFLWGFLNYLFGIGVALGGAALWLAFQRRRWWPRVLVSSTVALVCYLSHIAAFGFYALVVFGLELTPAWAELRARLWPTLGLRLALAGAQFVFPAALLFTYWRAAAGAPIAFGSIWRKADLLFNVFDNYSRGFDVACFALLLGLLGWLLCTRRLRLVPRLIPAIGAVLAAYLLLPSQLYSGSGTDHRLPVALFLLVIAASAPLFPNRGAALSVGAAAMLLLAIRLGVIEHVWRQADRVYAADLIGIEALPRGAKLAVANPTDAIHSVAVPAVHLPVLAVARREAFVPTLFAYPGQQPITLSPPYAALAAAASPQQLWSALMDGDAAELLRLLPVLQRYDYVAITGGGPIDAPSGRCLRPFFSQPSFEIVAVIHGPGCAGAGS
jgi:hypothetical protein